MFCVAGAGLNVDGPPAREYDDTEKSNGQSVGKWLS